LLIPALLHWRTELLRRRHKFTIIASIRYERQKTNGPFLLHSSFHAEWRSRDHGSEGTEWVKPSRLAHRSVVLKGPDQQSLQAKLMKILEGGHGGARRGLGERGLATSSSVSVAAARSHSCNTFNMRTESQFAALLHEALHRTR